MWILGGVNPYVSNSFPLIKSLFKKRKTYLMAKELWSYVLKSLLLSFEMRCCLLPNTNELPSREKVHVWFAIREP
jgi:hypothetical protein